MKIVDPRPQERKTAPPHYGVSHPSDSNGPTTAPFDRTAGLGRESDTQDDQCRIVFSLSMVKSCFAGFFGGPIDFPVHRAHLFDHYPITFGPAKSPVSQPAAWIQREHARFPKEFERRAALLIPPVAKARRPSFMEIRRNCVGHFGNLRKGRGARAPFSCPGTASCREGFRKESRSGRGRGGVLSSDGMEPARVQLHAGRGGRKRRRGSRAAPRMPNPLGGSFFQFQSGMGRWATTAPAPRPPNPLRPCDTFFPGTR